MWNDDHPSRGNLWFQIDRDTPPRAAVSGTSPTCRVVDQRLTTPPIVATPQVTLTRAQPAARRTRSDDDLHVAAEQHEESHEPVKGKSSQPTARERGDLELIDLEQLGGSGLRQAAGWKKRKDCEEPRRCPRGGFPSSKPTYAALWNSSTWRIQLVSGFHLGKIWATKISTRSRRFLFVERADNAGSGRCPRWLQSGRCGYQLSKVRRPTRDSRPERGAGPFRVLEPPAVHGRTVARTQCAAEARRSARTRRRSSRATAHRASPTRRRTRTRPQRPSSWRRR